MIATYELSRLFARALGSPPALAGAAAVLYCVGTDAVLSSGMETGVDVPLLLWLLLEVASPTPLVPRRAAKLGGIASLAILARLDIALVVVLGFIGWAVVAKPALRTFARVLLPFCAAGLAVPLYAAFNLAVFHAVLPYSAMAKQIVTRFGVNFFYLMATARWTVYGATAVPVLVAGSAALVALLRRRARGEEPAESQPRPEALFAGGLALAFAALFWGENTLNGWIYFGWYSYPFAAALIAALAFLGMLGARSLPGRGASGSSPRSSPRRSSSAPRRVSATSSCTARSGPSRTTASSR